MQGWSLKVAKILMMTKAMIGTLSTLIFKGSTHQQHTSLLSSSLLAPLATFPRGLCHWASALALQVRPKTKVYFWSPCYCRGSSTLSSDLVENCFSLSPDCSPTYTPVSPGFSQFRGLCVSHSHLIVTVSIIIMRGDFLCASLL